MRFTLLHPFRSGLIASLGRLTAIATSLLIFNACFSTKSSLKTVSKTIKNTFDTSRVLTESYSGFILLDADNGQVIYQRNSTKNFIPASTAKILTLAAHLKKGQDSLVGLEYIQTDTAFIFRGTGDPTFLHPQFETWQPVYQKLANVPVAQKLIYIPPVQPPARYAPGWAWEDYAEHFQPERSPMPIYGNCALLTIDPSGQYPVVYPRWFQYALWKGPEHAPVREEHTNRWNISGLKPGDTLYVPFHTTAFVDLLKDTLHRTDITIGSATQYPTDTWQQLKSCPTDTVYRLMMYVSDNFLAEQLAPPLPIQQSIRWVDGSGLSRYNLVSPQYLAQALTEMYQSYPHERLFALFPAGGIRGTIQNWYKAPLGESPYIFAKTGSMSGVQCLSGYLITKKNKVLIFSFMHNNFVGPGRPWKEEMQRILEYIHSAM